MKHLMIDLETMGASNEAAIVAIGAVTFSEDGLGDTFYRPIDLVDSVKYGKLDAATVKWWMQQSDEARAELNRPDAGGLATALRDFIGFYNNTAILGVWGFGATFDNVILRHAYKATGLPCPWHFRQDRCFRTLVALNPDVEWEPRTGTHHNALDDAVTQAKTAIKMLYPTIDIRL